MQHPKLTGPTPKQTKLIQDALKLHQSGQLDTAETQYRKLLKLLPNNTTLLTNLGTMSLQKGKLEEGVSIIGKSLQINPNQPDALYNQGNALKDLMRLNEAISSYDKVIAIKANYPAAYSNRGLVLQELNRPDEALESYNLAIALKSDYADAYYNRGNVLQELNQPEEAIDSYDRAIFLKPNYAEAYSNQGNALRDLKRLDEALACYNHAVALKPNYADAYYNRGNVLNDLKRPNEALASYDRAISLNPDIDFILGYSLHIKMQLCIWDDLPLRLTKLIHKIISDEKVTVPFSVLALIDSPEVQQKTAEIYVNEKYPQNLILPKIERYYRHSRIRIGYFSADFRNHPVSYLTAELYERHDRNQFEIHAFSFGPDTKDDMNLRIKAGVDHFHDVRMLSDKEIVMLSRKLEIDIAVDLGGFTKDSRTGLFAMQAAPIQISYIGYLGTMAAKYYDYLIADQTIVPTHNQKYYAEKMVYLPSYQVNDSKQLLPTTVLTRQDQGLPETGFVFCCFNNTYKITPTTFDGWARILKQVEGSVLLLYVDNESAKTNLTKEIMLRGIDPNRLIFAKHLPRLEYLARYQVADLFLDTLPYNAGTTASDALRMGLPVLTCMGHSFASRMAASLLNTVNLPELITTSQEQYESLAIELATHPEKLKSIKDKLVSNLPTAPLYDTSLFTRDLESAYLTMCDRQQKGLDSEHIYVNH
jgi:protein O-GlcNAc transferase